MLIALLGFGLLLAPGTSMRTVLTAVGKGLARARTFVVAALDLGDHDRGRRSRRRRIRRRPAHHRAVRCRRAARPSSRSPTLDLVDAEDAEDGGGRGRRSRETDGYEEALLVDEPELEDEDEDEEPLTAQIATDDEPTDIAVREGAKGQMAIDLTAYGHGDWTLPPRDLLKRSSAKAVDERVVEQGGEVLQATLRDFGVDAKLIGMTVGPTVTRYELELAPGVKVNRVTGLSHDIAYAMASPDVRILAPIPGRSAIGVEVPNKQRQLVTLGDILTSPEAAQATHPLECGLGRDIAGRSHMLNLATMPHLLIAGQTGAGKSSCINSLITSILMRCTPEQVRMILVDPKRVELGQYNGLPHLLTEVVTNPKKAANALEWAVREMDLRYDLLSEVGVRDITGYNAMYDRGELPTAENPDPEGGRSYERLPFIVIVVDELNDLMMVARARRRAEHLPDRADGPRRRHPPRDRDAAPVGRRHHRCDQGQRAEPARVLGEHARRLARHPRPARRREADRPRRHARARRRRRRARSASRARGSTRSACARRWRTGAARSRRRSTSRGCRATRPSGSSGGRGGGRRRR